MGRGQRSFIFYVVEQDTRFRVCVYNQVEQTRNQKMTIGLCNGVWITEIFYR